MEQTGYLVYETDNVATALCDLVPGPVRILGEFSGEAPQITQEIPRGHKFAVRPVACGESILKYHAVIGAATADISAGSHVHLHNMKSNFDERAATLDKETATATDIVYEL